MTEIDAIRLNFSPESLVALNVILALVMFGVALDMKLEDFKGIGSAPKAVLIGLLAVVAAMIREQAGVWIEVFHFHPSMVVVPVAMLAVGVVAGLLPAWRAYRTDVATTLAGT